MNNMKMAVILLLTMNIFLGIASAVSSEYWNKISDAGFSKQVLVGYNATSKTTNVYSIHKTTGEIYKYDNKPMSWTKIKGNIGKMYVTHGSNLVEIAEYSNFVWSWNSVDKLWYTLSIDPAGKIYGGQDHLLKTDLKNGNLYAYSDRMNWVYFGGPGKTFVVGSDYNMAGLSTIDSSVWKFDDSKPNHWAKIYGSAKNIYAGGAVLFLTRPKTGTIWKYNGVPFSWTRIGGSGKKFSVGKDGILYGLSPNGDSVWKWTGNPNEWKQIGGPAKDITGGADEDLFAINENGEIWYYAPPKSGTTD